MTRAGVRTAALGGFLAVGALDAWLAGDAEAGAHRARLLIKPALMPLLATALLNRRGIEDSPMRNSTLLGEAAGWVGDVILLEDGTVAIAAGQAPLVSVTPRKSGACGPTAGSSAR